MGYVIFFLMICYDCYFYNFYIINYNRDLSKNSY